MAYTSLNDHIAYLNYQTPYFIDYLILKADENDYKSGHNLKDSQAL